jgi:hypothetical protein
MTREFDPDKWWTWPIPEYYISTYREDGETVSRVTPEGDAWIEGFEAGRNSLAAELLDRNVTTDHPETL